MRILQVLDKISNNSGACAVVMNYYYQMSSGEVIFDFLVHEKTPELLKKEIEKNGSKIYEMPQLCGKNIIDYQRKLKRFFEEHTEYFIIHGHIPNAALFYMAAAKKAGVSIRILHAHSSRGSDKFLKNIRNLLMTRLGVCYANKFFACSQKAANYMYGKKWKEAYILRNAIDTRKYRFNKEKRLEYREKLNIRNECLIGHIGRFSKEKNHLFLLQLLQKLNQRENNYRLLLIGDGKEREQIINMAKKLGVEKIIICTGIVDNVNDYLNAMDVFVLPSLYEGLPVVGVEAQCNGLPCLFSDRITSEAALTELVQYLSIDDVCKWTETIFEHDFVRQEDAWKIVERKGYSIEQEAKRLQEYYKSLSLDII